MTGSSRSRLKVMQITHDLAIGGLQTVVLNICRAIDRQRFDVSVLCLRRGGELVAEVERLGVEVVLLPKKAAGVDYWAFLKVARILRERRIDVIHTHNTQPLVDGTLGAMLAGVRTIVHTDHARKYPDKRRYMFAEWVLSHFVSRIAAVSEATAEDLVKYERVSRRKIVTIPNGVDLAGATVSRDRESMKRSLGIGGKGPVLGLGVRLSRQKGITYLLQAMPEVVRRYPDAVLVIAGEGECAPDLKQEAAALGLDGHTLFLGKRLDMPDVLTALDLYVLPSVWEGLPMVLLEAMAAGCPVIATDVGGVGTVLGHGECGSLVEPSNPPALAREILRVLGDESLRRRYSASARARVERRFTTSAMTRKYERLYLGEDLPPEG